MATQNMLTPDDSNSEFSPIGSDLSIEEFGASLEKVFKAAEKVVDRIIDKIKLGTASLEQATGVVSSQTPGSGKLGLGSFTRGQVATGLGLGVVASGAVLSSMAPNTMAAVTQAMGASTYAGFAGMTNMQATRLANKQVGMGATSAMGPTMAAMTLSNMGLLAGSASSNSVMGQLAGLSAMTGMSNEQAAASMGSINGMMFLRAGIRVRDSNGNLLPPNQIVNNAWNAITRGRPYTQAQVAATFLSPSGAGYQTLQAISGGDPNLLATLQSGFMARAKIGKDITAGQMSNAQTMLGAMGVDKTSPMYSNFKNNTAQANLLASTESGLVGGYNTALNTNADLTNGLAGMANAVSGVTKALMGLKGFLQSFGAAGSVGGTVSGLASMGVGAAVNAYTTKKILGTLGVAKKGPGLLTSLGNVGKSVLGGLGRLLGMAAPIAEDAAVLGGPYDHGSMGQTGVGGPSGGHENILPVPQGTPVSSPYGSRGGGAKTKGFHPGVDYGVKTGTNVYAHDSGTVTIVGNGGGYGNYIEIDHGSYKTRYAHLSSILVSRGQKVGGGQVIAKSGNTGNTTGPHLHFEVLVNGKKVNPAPYLVGAGTSRSTAASASRSTSGNINNPLSLGTLGSPTDINSILSSFNSGSYANLSSLFGSSGAKNLSSNSSMSFIKGQLQATAGIILGTGNQQEWARTLLGKLGKPATPDNIKALTTWAAWEGGQWHNSAHYNPLNTTQPENGATNMNKEGVKSYTSWNQGYAATVATLNNGRYRSILNALSKGNNAGAVLSAVDHSSWGTHIPGYGGPNADLGTGTITASLPMSSGGYGSGGASRSSGSPVNVNFNVKFYAQQASVADAKRFVKMIEDEAKKSSLLKTIGSIG